MVIERPTRVEYCGIILRHNMMALRRIGVHNFRQSWYSLRCLHSRRPKCFENNGDQNNYLLLTSHQANMCMIAIIWENWLRKRDRALVEGGPRDCEMGRPLWRYCLSLTSWENEWLNRLLSHLSYVSFFKLVIPEIMRKTVKGDCCKEIKNGKAEIRKFYHSYQH